MDLDSEESTLIDSLDWQNDETATIEAFPLLKALDLDPRPTFIIDLVNSGSNGGPQLHYCNPALKHDVEMCKDTLLGFVYTSTEADECAVSSLYLVGFVSTTLSRSGGKLSQQVLDFPQPLAQVQRDRLGNANGLPIKTSHLLQALL